MFYALDEYPCLGSKGLSLYPDEWDDQQDMSPTRVRFTPASGALEDQDTWFEYYRGLNDLISASGVVQIGVRTAAVATFNGYNFDPQRAANPVIEDAFAGAPEPVASGLYNDMRAVVYDDKIRLFVAIYGNPSGSNRTAIFESTDGFTFTYVGEAQKGGTYLGRTIGALANVSGTLVSLVSIADGAGGGNGRQKWISLDGGLTWLDRGLAIHVGDDGDWNGLNYVGGTMQLVGDYYVALLPGMPFIGNNGGGSPYLDWPEAVGAFRIPAANILTANVLWEANSSNPLIIAGPTHNALWHMALFEDRGTTYSTVETWGVPGFENIGTATTRTLRTTPYYGTESRVSSSQLYELKMASRHWLDHWTTPVVANGTYTLRHVQSGKFVSVVDGQPVLTEAGTIAEFAVERELSFYTISNADLCLSAIDDLMQTGFEFVENPGAVNNAKGQWLIMPWEDRPADQPQLVVLTNRYSRLAASLPRDTETEGAPLVQAPFLGHASMIFELAPVVRAETTTEFPDPENPLLNMELPAGNLLGSLGSDTAQHLAVVNIPRAEAVTRNLAGEWATLPNGTVMNFGGYLYAKLSGSTVLADLLGWVPLEPLNILQFASESALAANAQPAIRAALLFARTQVQDIPQSPARPGFAGHVAVDLAGKSWMVSNTVSMDQCAGTELVNGALIADVSTFPTNDYVLKFGGANNSGSRYMNIRNLFIECNHIASGVEAVNLQNGFAENINIHGQTQYGLRKWGSRNGACRFRNIRASEYWSGETSVGLRAARTSIGISDEAADEIFENCEGVYCLTNLKISGNGAHRHIGGHPFHGPMTDIKTFIITGAVSDGASGTRFTVASTDGMTDGAIYVLPWIDGISAVNSIGGRPGSYVISNVTGTTFDAAAYGFAGSFAASDSPKATAWDDEMVNVLIEADVNTADLDLEIDNGKVQVMQTAGGSPDVRMRLTGVGQNATSARVALELVANGVTDATFAGVEADIHTANNGYRMTAINGGSVATVVKAAIREFRVGKPNRSTELVVVGQGNATQPALRFTAKDQGGAIDTDATTGLYGEDDHTVSGTIDGVKKFQFAKMGLLLSAGYPAIFSGAGSASAPLIAASADETKGIYWDAATGTWRASNASGNHWLSDRILRTRAEVVAMVAALGTNATVGDVLGWDGLFVKYTGADTTIADMPKWVPVGDVYPDHFKENTTPGTTDMAAAINAARVFASKIMLRGVVYKCFSQIGQFTNVVVEGVSRESSIIEFSSSIPIGTSAILSRRRSQFRRLTLRYEAGTLTGSEDQYDRVLLQLDNNAGNGTAKAAAPLSDVKMDNAGTFITTKAASFNYSIRDVFLGEFSYVAIDVPASTGLSWDNIYIEGTLSWTVAGVIWLRANDGGNFSGTTADFGQINIHQIKSSGPLIVIDRQETANFRSLHTEAIELTGSNNCMIKVDRSNVHFENYEFLHTAIPDTGCSFFRLGNGGSIGTSTYLSSQLSTVTFGKLSYRGVNNPNSAYWPGYVNGIDHVPTWKWFVREPGATGDYVVGFRSDPAWHIYSGDVSANETRIYRGLKSLSDAAVTFRDDMINRNFIANDHFESWATFSTATNNAATASGWIMQSVTGTLTTARKYDAWQGRNIPLLNMNNVGTVGTHQRAQYLVADPRPLADQSLLTLSFIGKATVAGRRLDSITIYMNDGVSASNTVTLTGSMTELQFDTVLKRHTVTFAAPVSTGFAWSNAAYLHVRFNINNASATYESDVSIGEIKLEIGGYSSRDERA